MSWAKWSRLTRTLSQRSPSVRENLQRNRQNLLKDAQEANQVAVDMNQINLITVENKAYDSSFGPWMIAQRPQRRNSRNVSGINGAKRGNGEPMQKLRLAEKDKETVSGSRFDILQEECVQEIEPNQENFDKEVGISVHDKWQVPEENISRLIKIKGKLKTKIIGGKMGLIIGKSHVKMVTTKIMGQRSEVIIKGINNAEEVQRVQVDGALRGKITNTCPTGPGKHFGETMGLNLKQQVKFKNVKKAARNAGVRIGLNLLFRDNLFGLEALVLNSGPDIGGSEGGRVVFNNRPPDLVANGNHVNNDNQCMEISCEQMNVEDLNEEHVQAVQLSLPGVS
ncbi:hypothetical protein SESBI_00737 [Sesbania bispinosa]|nr:hypothetical protein SESBI_00737 [Sesbania bispinosa]